MMYLIYLQYTGCVKEVLDRADTLSDAEYLVSEYKLEYGAGWKVWFVEQKAA